MSLYKESSLYVIGRGAPALISFLGIAIYTHLLDPAEYGYFSMVVAIVAFINSVFFQWLRFGLMRFRARYSSREVEFLSVIFYIFIMLLVLTGLLGAGAWVLMRHEVWNVLVLVGVLVLWGQAWTELNLELFRSRFEVWYYSTYSVLRAGISLLAGIVLIKLDYGESGPLLGLVVSAVLSALVLSRKRWRGVSPKFIYLGTAKDLLRYGMPLSATAIFAFIISNTDRFMIASMLGIEKAGVYAPSYDIAQQSLGILMLVIYLAGFPRIVSAQEESDSDKVQEKLKNYFSLFIEVSLPAVVGLILLAPSIAVVVLGEAYEEGATNIMPLIALATLFSGFKAYYIDMSFQLSEITKTLVLIALVSAIVNFFLNLLWIPVYGLEGAAYATIASYALSLSLSWFFGRKKMKLPLVTISIVKIFFSLLVMVFALMEVVGFDGVLGLVFQVIVGVLSYGAAIFIMKITFARVGL